MFTPITVGTIGVGMDGIVLGDIGMAGIALGHLVMDMVGMVTMVIMTHFIMDMVIMEAFIVLTTMDIMAITAIITIEEMLLTTQVVAEVT